MTISSSQSEYAKGHFDDHVPVVYDEHVYRPNSYDSYIWNRLQRPHLLSLIEKLAATRGRLKYLDFACGTGRIIAAAEHLADEATGIDISPQMLSFARSKVSSRAVLKDGDILADPHLAGFDYDVITAYRFFLNTEPEMRPLVMSSLARRLAGPESRLIFNIHLNAPNPVLPSPGLVTSIVRRMRGWPGPAMNSSQVRQLVADAGLEIEAWYGFGIVPYPYPLYRSPLAPMAKLLDRLTARSLPLRWIGQDLVFVCKLRDAAKKGVE